MIHRKLAGGQWQAIPQAAGRNVQSEEGAEDERAKKEMRGGYNDWPSSDLSPSLKAVLEWEKMLAAAKELGRRDTMEELHRVSYYTVRLELKRIRNKPIARTNVFPIKKESLLKMEVVVCFGC